ncbi:MAG: hypothetical protein IKJ39_11355 [Lachnospiraceae bacterium]|nr:hypothetical protein [Lachnospiraceae bacterium]
MTGRMYERNVRRGVRKEAVFVLFTVFMILSLWFFISEKVMSQNNGTVTVDEAAFLELESNYLSQVKVYLEEEGFRNSGVALSRVIETDGSRSYEITLHHKKLNELSLEEQKKLKADIEELAFGVSGCEFQVTFLG